MFFEDWWKKYKSKGVDYDGAYGEQCVDLANSYAEECLNIKGCFSGIEYAYQCFNSTKSTITKNFKKISNSASNYPLKGDVIIWKKERNGYAGHIAIVKSATKNSVTVYEQNYDGRGKSRSPKKADGGIREYKYTNYNNVAGWLRPQRKIKASGGLNLRKTSSMSSPVNKVMPNNTAVTVIGCSGDWLQVRHGGTYGYCKKEFTTSLK